MILASVLDLNKKSKCFKATSLLAGLFTLLVSNSSLATDHFEPEFKSLPLINTTFQYSGPNCFGAALLGAGVYENIRGVDVGEFTHVLETSCEAVEMPIEGDIGVFESASGFMPIHAFMYLDEQTAYEKQGVDYDGKTPITLVDLEDVKYRVEASPLCRRFGDESCYNKLKYYRCKRYEKSESLKSFEVKLESVLMGKRSYNQIALFRELYSVEGMDPSTLESITKQIEFIYGRSFVNPENYMVF